jgi:hypothetical protein
MAHKIIPRKGHEKTDTVQIYLHADLALKERALARTAPLGAKPGRYKPPDALLAFLSMASRNCPVADMKTARWWPWDLPSWRPPTAFG